MKQLLPGLVTTGILTCIALASAGTWSYLPAWLYLAVGVASTVGRQWALRGRPRLAEERSRPGDGSEAWDRKLLGLGFLATVATLVVAGLDSGRYHWTPTLARICPYAGTSLALLGSALFLWAMRENRFFSAVVRIQDDRGHEVCTTGPYRFLRHPGNTGMIVGTLGLPLLFVSAWAAIPALLNVAILVLRTHKEDVLLVDRLAGYRAYAAAVPYRLLPGVW